MTGTDINGGQFRVPMGETPTGADGCSITVDGRCTAPRSLTLNPWPCLVPSIDADDILPGREWREILSGPPPCSPNHQTTVGVEAADKRRAGKKSP
jgi:hypothetical protein